MNGLRNVRETPVMDRIIEDLGGWENAFDPPWARPGRPEDAALEAVAGARKKAGEAGRGRGQPG